MSDFFAATKEAIRNFFKAPNTVMFPFAEVPTPSDFRGAPKLTAENCTLCNRCVRVCPTDALSIEKSDKTHGVFIIDLGRCCYCKNCENVCNFDAIHLTLNWKTSSVVRDDLKKVSAVEVVK